VLSGCIAFTRASPPRPLLAVPDVTAHPSTASVPITVLLYNGPVICGFNMGIKWQATAISIETRTNQTMQTQQLMGIAI